MVRNSLFFILSIVSISAFANVIDQPPLENARGIVVHNSVDSSPFSLTVGSLLNCKETEDHYRIDCDLDETTAIMGDNTVTIQKLRFVEDDEMDQTFYLFGKINFHSDDFAAERDILIGILVKKDGTKRGYIRIDDLGLSEQLILEPSDSL